MIGTIFLLLFTVKPLCNVTEFYCYIYLLTKNLNVYVEFIPVVS